MAVDELNFDPKDIAEALRKNVESYTPSVEREEVGRVVEAGDGIARVKGLPRRDGQRAARVPRRGARPRVQPGRGRDRLHHPGRVLPDRGGPSRQADRQDPVDPGGRRVPGPRDRPPRRPAGRQGPDPGRGHAGARAPGSQRRRPPAGEGAAADRHHRDRRDDADRARSARADHRRPPDRQDRGGDRRDHRPARQLDQRRPQAAGPVHLRRGGAEGLDRGRGGRDPERQRRPRVHGRRERVGVGPHALPVHRPVLGRGPGRVLDVRGQARPRRLRRPVEAGDRLPDAVPAAPPAAGTRGVPRRRVLPPLPAARARGQALRPAGRRVAHGAADRRDQGQRHLGLHPDQRDLDHRRSDLPRARPVLRRGSPGDQRRHVGVARGRQRADQGDEEDRRHAPHRDGAVPGARGVRAVRLRAGQGVAEAARARRPRGRDPQAAAVPAGAGRAAGRRDLGGHGRLPGRPARRGRQAVRGRVHRAHRGPDRRPGLDPEHGRALRRGRGHAQAGARGLHGGLRAVRRGRGERVRRRPGRAEGSGPGGRRLGSPVRRTTTRTSPRARAASEPWARSSASSAGGSVRSSRR